jgi:Ca2+-binding EF-hand superfamily protein
VLRITVFFELILLYTFIHRILGYIAGYLIRSKLDPEKTGKFNIHIEWISFRVGLDWNQVVIHGIEWRNPPGFNSGKHIFLLRIVEVSLAIDVLSVYRAVTTSSSIHINSFIISGVDIHIKRHSNRVNGTLDRNDNNALNGKEPLLRNGVLNFSAAVGAVDEVEEHSMLEQIGDHLSDAMGTSIYMMGVMTDAVVKYNPFTVLKKTATYIGKRFRSLLRKSSNLHSQKMITEMMDAYKSEEELQVLFRKYDKDSSGFLDKDELREVLYASNSAFTDEEVDVILSMLDSSGDGRITYEEFSLWWKNKDKRGVDLKEALSTDEESSKADEYFKNKHESALLGIPYKFEINNLQISQFGAVYLQLAIRILSLWHLLAC